MAVLSKKAWWNKIMKVKKAGPNIFWFILGIAMAATGSQVALYLAKAEIFSQIIFFFILLICWGAFIFLPKIYLHFREISRDLTADCFEK
ncbi:MAG: hypothetical protein WC456_04245 [Patescibacteria group bacterium]